MKQGKKEEAEAAKAEVAALKARSTDLLKQADDNNAELQAQLVLLPNIPCDLVPEGAGAEDNLVVKMGGVDPQLPENALPHWELARKYDIIDFDLGVKITGAGFPVYKGKGARLQRALINFFLDRNTAAGYQEVEPPVMVNAASGFGTGQLPDKEGQMYHATVDDFYMVPTAEVPVTNIFRDVILSADQFPQKLTAYTPCFRREAGSYGKDVRGLNRLHQFDKVEIVRIEKPENSYAALDEMVAHVEKLVQDLGLRYRILRLCGGDLSFTSAITYDFEVRRAGPLARDLFRLQLRELPGEPPEVPLQGREREDAAGPHPERQLPRAAESRGGAPGGQPEGRLHRDSGSPSSLHRLRPHWISRASYSVSTPEPSCWVSGWCAASGRRPSTWTWASWT